MRDGHSRLCCNKFQHSDFSSLILYFATILAEKCPASLFSSQAHIGMLGLFARKCFFFSVGRSYVLFHSILHIL